VNRTCELITLLFYGIELLFLLLRCVASSSLHDSVYFAAVVYYCKCPLNFNGFRDCTLYIVTVPSGGHIFFLGVHLAWVLRPNRAVSTASGGNHLSGWLGPNLHHSPREPLVWGSVPETGQRPFEALSSATQTRLDANPFCPGRDHFHPHFSYVAHATATISMSYFDPTMVLIVAHYCVSLLPNNWCHVLLKNGSHFFPRIQRYSCKLDAQQ
jgi:hypothetical protein